MNFRCENLVFGRLNKLMFKSFPSSKYQNVSFLGSNGVKFRKLQKVVTFKLNLTLGVSFPENYFQGHLGSPEVRNSKKGQIMSNLKNQSSKCRSN